MNIYSPLLKLYKSKSLKTPLEDFTTESLVGLLKSNKTILDEYVYEVLGIEGDNFTIATQYPFKNQKNETSIIDILIENDKYRIFIENKVNAKEGNGQLTKYLELLKEDRFDDKENHLIYCTKYLDLKSLENLDKVKFKQIRWKNIFNFLKERKVQVAEEFRKFLEEERIVSSKEFKLTDIFNMGEMIEIFPKIEEVLSETIIYMKEKLNIDTRGFKRMEITEIADEKKYGKYKWKLIKGEDESSLLVSFSFDTKVPSLEIVACLGKEKKYLEIENELMIGEGFKIEWDEDVVISNSVAIDEIMKEEFPFDSMVKWFQKQIDILENFKTETPELIWN